jgi:gluconate 5-dehydrogenase
VNLDDHAVYARQGVTGAREAAQSASRRCAAADVVGEHTVIFAGPGERVELTHKAASRQNFAAGALRAGTVRRRASRAKGRRPLTTWGTCSDCAHAVRPMPPGDPFHLGGRLALVTGGGSGLGLAICARSCARGCPRDHQRPQHREAGAGGGDAARRRHRRHDAAVRCHRPGGRHRVHGVDRPDARPLDILVNNAAVNTRKPLDAFSLEEWRALQAANLDGPFLVARAALPGMKARRNGKIINICSLASDLGRPNIVPYAVSKGGVRMLTRALAVELAPFNVQVNGLAPGFFDTEMNRRLVADAQFSAWVERRVPAGRWAKPPEIAGAAVFLASPAADFVTGHILYVDGGFAAAY